MQKLGWCGALGVP